MNDLTKKIITFFVLISFIPSFVSQVNAVEDQFEINLSVTTTDVSPPTIPSGLTASAVSTSQINLSWSASTDDVGVTAYRVFRDSVFIATSTLTSHSDIGLSASTLYTYTVSAVDASFNDSGESLSASATTLSPSTPTTPSPGGGVISSLRIINTNVSTSESGAVLTWQTNRFAVSSLSWGKTRDYELGTSVGVFFLTSHVASINFLEPGGKYFFRISARDSIGRETFFDGEFETIGISSEFQNPINFRGTPLEKDILLEWNNPITPNFEEVRILRSDKFFPSDPYDGEIVYEGRGSSYLDQDVEIGKRYYYTIFAKSVDGRYSSGAITQAMISATGEIIPPIKDIFDELPKAPTVHPVIERLSLIDFDFIQEGKIQSFFEGETVIIDGTKNLTVSLDYGKVPEILKTILITLIDPEDSEKVFSFLLRVDEDKSRYSATIGPLGKSGTYGVRISIIDYKNQGLKKIEGELLATTGRIPFTGDDSVFVWLGGIIVERFWNLLLLLIILAILIEGFKKAFSKKNKKTVKENREKNKYGERL